MDELKITKRTEPVMFTIRVDKSIVDFYDELSRKTNRSRNELIGMALLYWMEIGDGDGELENGTFCICLLQIAVDLLQ